MRRRSTYELIQVQMDQPPARTVTLTLRPKENDISKLQRKKTEDEEMKKNKERVRDRSSSNSRYNICENTITGTNGAKGVEVSNFGNVDVQGQAGGEGMKGFPENGGGYNISGNLITGDGVGTSNIGINNFGNTTFTTEDDHGEEAEGGSSPPKPQWRPTG